MDPEQLPAPETAAEEQHETIREEASGETSGELPVEEFVESAPPVETEISACEAHLSALRIEEAELRADILRLTTQKQEILEAQLGEMQSTLRRITQESLSDLERRKKDLEDAIAVLQRKQERLQTEMRTTYAGVSQDVAVRVQGFKDYLVGSLQDLVATAERLNLTPPQPEKAAEPVIQKEPEPPKLAEQAFGEYRQKLEQTLERYRTLPDYYGPAWKLRRTFEAIHAERVASWFFQQAGRGAIRTMGTRLQNILVASAAISLLRSMYGEKLRVLVLATSPERLGEWRRGFQDCLGLGRENFGPEKGIVLFEDPDPLSLKGDRLSGEGQMPLVVLDEAEEFIAVDLLRFPLLLAFGRDPQAKPTYSARDRDRDFRDF